MGPDLQVFTGWLKRLKWPESLEISRFSVTGIVMKVDFDALEQQFWVVSSDKSKPFNRVYKRVRISMSATPAEWRGGARACACSYFSFACPKEK